MSRREAVMARRGDDQDANERRTCWAGYIDVWEESIKEVTMKKAKQSAVTVYVVLEDVPGDLRSRPDLREKRMFPVHFLVYNARNTQHAIARVECEWGRAVPEPVVMPLSRYRSWTHANSRESGNRRSK